jgi:hypothetical protein
VPCRRRQAAAAACTGVAVAGASFAKHLAECELGCSTRTTRVTCTAGQKHLHSNIICRTTDISTQEGHQPLAGDVRQPQRPAQMHQGRRQLSRCKEAGASLASTRTP